jgi:cell division protease FtsH
MPRQSWFTIWYAIFAVIGVLWLRELYVTATQVQPIPYSEFEQSLKAGEIKDIQISNNVVQGSYKNPRPDKRTRFVTTRVDPELAKQLSQYDVTYSGVVESTFFRDILSFIAPALVFFAIWYFLARRMTQGGGLGGGLLSIGKSKAKVYVETDTKTTFADVAGVEEAKEELQEVVGFLKDPKRYTRLGGHIPKGVLLVGPPGTGKTLLARAVAGEAGVPFFSINGSEFVEMFVGVGAARVRDLFEQGRARAPAIIFIDELDALGRARGAYGIGGHDEKEQTLNQLLVEMDGFDASQGLILIAATNRPEILDPALLRAGRFDRQVLVDRPDKLGRVQILKVHARKVKLAPDADLEKVAALTPGFTGADLANLINEAALFATRRGADAVSLADFTSAVERIVAGLEKKSRILNTKEREIVAHHEMGHALVALALPGTDPVHKVSIIPRGIGSLGYTIQRPTEDRFLMTREELENKMAVLLGGRAAEHVVYGHLSTGAADDLAKVTDIARGMVMRYGMEPKLGNLSYQDEPSPLLPPTMPVPPSRQYSDETAREIDHSVRAITETAFERAVGILRANRIALDRGARLLLQKETLAEEEIAAIAATLKQAA